MKMRLKKNILTVLIVFVSFMPIFLIAQSNLIGLWSGEVTRNGFDWNIQIHIGELEEGLRTKVSLPDFGMFQLETDSFSLKGNQIMFKIKWLDAYFEGKVQGNYMEGIWDKGTAKAHLHRSSANAGLLKTETVSLKMDDDAILKGTLILPNGKPPYTGMILTHGSGPDTRVTGPYLSKAMLAAQNGIATLIYDKRGAGESTGDKGYDIIRLAKDAGAMLGWLRTHTQIDSTKVGVGGISQGAWVAPMVAATDPRVAFVFVTATPGLSPAEQNVFTLETRFEANGLDEKSIMEAKKTLRTLYEYYRTGDSYYRTEAIKMMQASNAAWASSSLFKQFTFTFGKEVATEIKVSDWAFMFVDPLLHWREITVPVASFSGADDNNIPTKYSLDVIKAALGDAKNQDFEIHSYPGAGHGITLLNRAEGDWARMAPGYIPMMAAWFARMAKK